MFADDLLSDLLAEECGPSLTPPSARAIQNLKDNGDMGSSASTNTPSAGTSASSTPDPACHVVPSSAEPKWTFRRRASSMLSEDPDPPSVPRAPLFTRGSTESLESTPLPKKDLDGMFQKVNDAKASAQKEQEAVTKKGSTKNAGDDNEAFSLLQI